MATHQNFDVYQGKSGGDNVCNGMPSYFGLGEKVIYEFTKDLHGLNYEVYFDNYFTSIPLLEYLKAKRVSACGTIRSTRKYLPHDLTIDKNLSRGNYDYRVSDQDLVYYKWKDNKSVHLASNFHGTDASSLLRLRTQKNGERLEFSCPKAVKDYNEYMGGVDKADMLCSIYGLGRKSKKWWHRIFFGILDRTLSNAFIVFCKINGTKPPSLEFRCQVCQSLITLGRPTKVGRPLSNPRLTTPKRRKSAFSTPASIRLEKVGVHLVIYDNNRGRYEVCSSKKIQSRPHSKCSMCKVFLCSNEKKNCFIEFHGASYMLCRIYIYIFSYIILLTLLHF